jgi:predicted Na+-dependent transporter
VIFAILLIPSLLASWFCYWFSSVFPFLSNRTSRIICIACPAVLAILLAVIVSNTLGASGTDFPIPDHPRRTIPALIVAIAAVLVIPTLLLAFAAARLRSYSENRKNG